MIQMRGRAEIRIEGVGKPITVKLGLFVIVVPQCAAKRTQPVDPTATWGWGSLSGEFRHQFIDVLELLIGSPTLVATPPVGAPVEPHSEGLGPILEGMALGIPGV